MTLLEGLFYGFYGGVLMLGLMMALVDHFRAVATLGWFLVIVAVIALAKA